MIKRIIVALLVLTVIFIGIVSVHQGDKVTATCGPTVSTPWKIRMLDKSIDMGKEIARMKRDGAIGVSDMAHFVYDLGHNFNVWWTNLRGAANDSPENDWATGWRNQTAANQAAALAACCANLNTNVPNQDNGDGSGPDDGGEQGPPVDSIPASYSPGLTGKALAEAALIKAAPNDTKWQSQIKLGVAIAKYESSYNVRASNGSHFGLWQISSDNVKRLKFGDPYDPYINAKYAYALWQGRKGTWSKDWTTYQTALNSIGGSGSVPDPVNPGTQANPIPNAGGTSDPASGNPYCPATNNASGGNGDVSGEIVQIAELNPSGAGNWQGAVRDGNDWYVQHATAGDRTLVIHHLNASGVEMNKMTITNPGAHHPSGFGVLNGTVYTTVHGKVVSIPYHEGTVNGATGAPTGWNGQITFDPNGKFVAIRNGNKYVQYDFATKQQIGTQIKTSTGMRQGFGLSNGYLYVLSGATNQDASVVSYSFSTGQIVGTRNITSVGYKPGETVSRHSYREPEGMYGSTLGVKMWTGDKRRLRIFNFESSSDIASQVGYTPSGQVRSVVDYVTKQTFKVRIPAGKAGIAVNAALDLASTRHPYRWGKTGPTYFDCSGMVSWAWKKAGINVYPQSGVIHNTVPKATGPIQGGDILWHPDHVQMAAYDSAGNQIIIEAPHTGDFVRIRQHNWMKPQGVYRPTSGVSA